LQKSIGPCKTVKTTDSISPFLRGVDDVSFDIDMKPPKSLRDGIDLLDKLPNFLMIMILFMEIHIKKSIPNIRKKIPHLMSKLFSSLLYQKLILPNKYGLILLPLLQQVNHHDPARVPHHHPNMFPKGYNLKFPLPGNFDFGQLGGLFPKDRNAASIVLYTDEVLAVKYD
jgi:hypothetical protein